ncbi:MAG: protease complex subunit PrcB family protein [Planctomycetota bacterium]
MKYSVGTLGVLLALVCPGLGSAQQSYPFESVAQGVGGGVQSGPERLLIQTPQQLQQSGAATLLPPGASVDFAREALIVVKMGSQPTGGYWIEVRDVEVRPSSGSTPGGPAVSLTTQLRVTVFSRSPGPGELVTQAFTSPFHVVKVQRPPAGGLVASFEDVATAVDFDSFRRSEGSLVHATSIQVTRDGAVEIHERAPGSSAVTRQSGQVGPARVEQLRQALAQADFAGLPADLGNDPQLMDAPGVGYSLSLGGADTVKSGTLTLISPALRARLRPIDAALASIRDEVFAQLPAFDQLTFTTRTPEGADTLIRTLTIAADGTARVDQRYLVREVLILARTAQVEAATLDQIALRVRLANVNSLPAQLPTPIHVTAPETFALEVASQNPEHTGATAGEPGYYESYRFRLERLVDLLTAERDRVIQTGTPAAGQERKGEVVLQGADVLLREPQGDTLLTGDLARTVRQFPGETVKVGGQRAPTGEFEVTAILYPERQTLDGISTTIAGRPHLLVSGSRALLTGSPARGLASLGSARQVQVDGWVFTEFNTQALTRVHLEGVSAVVERFSFLTLSGAFRGVVRRGDRVQVLALSRSGRYARISHGGDEGYMPLSRLEIGRSPLTPQPGLSGSLPH